MTRSFAGTIEHDDIVEKLVHQLTINNFQNIKADIKGLQSPDKINGEIQDHIPDVTATLNSTMYIFEVETEDTIAIDHTASQWTLFSDYATNVINGVFTVVVPQAAEEAARIQLLNLGIGHTEVWTA